MVLIMPIEQVTSTIENYLLKEMQDDNGLLSDVKTLIGSFQTQKKLSTPMIWIHQHPTQEYTGQSGGISNKKYLSVEFEFICVDYDRNVEKANVKSTNLAERVLSSILLHYHRRPNSLFQFVHCNFKGFYPSGEVSINNKQDGVPACSVLLEFVYYTDWLLCETMNTRKQNVHIRLDDVEGSIGDDVTLKAYITDMFGEKVDEGDVEFEKDDGKKKKVTVKVHDVNAKRGETTDLVADVTDEDDKKVDEGIVEFEKDE